MITQEVIIRMCKAMKTTAVAKTAASVLMSVLIVAFVFEAKANTGSILEKPISISISNEEVKIVLSKIEKIGIVCFSYNPDILPLGKKISIQCKGEPLRNALDRIFNDQSLQYKAIENLVVIYRNEVETQALQVYGRVVDKMTKTPISFANVSIMGQNIGTISDEDGYFHIKVARDYVPNKIAVSFIGYDPCYIPVNDIDNSDLLIELAQVDFHLPEIKIQPIDPVKLIKSALSKIPQNYDNKPEMVDAQFNETIKQDDQYVAYSEASLLVYKASYRKNWEEDRIKVIDGRQKTSKRAPKILGFKLTGGPYNFLKLDIIKNQVDFLSSNGLKYYEYEYKGTIEQDNHNLHVITFDQRDNIEYPHYKGVLYLDENSLAVVKASFGISPKGIKYAYKAFSNRVPPGFLIRFLKADYEVNYTCNGGKWQLERTKGVVERYAVNVATQSYTIFSSVSELSIRNHRTENVKKIPYYQTFQANDILIDIINELKK